MITMDMETGVWDKKLPSLFFELDDYMLSAEYFNDPKNEFANLSQCDQGGMELLHRMEEEFKEVEEFHKLLEKDPLLPELSECPLTDPLKDTWWSSWSHNKEAPKGLVPEVPSQANEGCQELSESDNFLTIDKYNDREEFYIMVNPKTCSTSVPEKSPEYLEPQPSLKHSPSYHIFHDHDYVSFKKEEDLNVEIKKEEDIESCLPNEDEPVVDVWEIDNFCHKQTLKSLPAADEFPAAFRQMYLQQERRSSARAAEMKRREQARKISNAVHAVFKVAKPRRRPYKIIKPKNSVETTPSQSDIEEYYSRPIRPTCTRIAKKKSCKGRIDHSESERHRREVLRTNFSYLSDLIPNKYLRGDNKPSSQISKQKILTGAKAFISALLSCKSSYKSLFRVNKKLGNRWLKCYKLLKSILNRI